MAKSNAMPRQAFYKVTRSLLAYLIEFLIGRQIEGRAKTVEVKRKSCYDETVGYIRSVYNSEASGKMRLLCCSEAPLILVHSICSTRK